MKPCKILIADDDELVVQGLHQILDEPEVQIVGTVRDGRAFLKAVEETEPDLAILEVSLPLLNGVEAVRQIRSHNPHVKIVFLTKHAEVDYAVEALAAGATAYVLKASSCEEIGAAIEAACHNEKFITPCIEEPVRQALEGGATDASIENSPLTARQREVVRLLLEGHSMKEAAAILGVSPRTVEFHKYAAMEAVGVMTVAELAVYAAKNRLATS